MSRSLADIWLAALMIDGIELKGRCCTVALRGRHRRRQGRRDGVVALRGGEGREALGATAYRMSLPVST